MSRFNKENMLTLTEEKNSEYIIPNKSPINCLNLDDTTCLKVQGGNNTKFDPELEPLLRENPTRFVIFPIQYPDIWAKYKQSEALFWTTEEIDLSRDLSDWRNRLSDNERRFISHILALFTISGGIVSENIAHRFSQEVQVTEARCFYGYQISNENIHSEMYSMLIETYISDEQEKEFLFNATETLSYVKKKTDWILSWSNNKNASFGERIVGFAAVESIFFAGGNAAIFWIKKRGLLPGLTVSNDFISRDERLHCEFACLIFSHLVQKPPKQRIQSIIEDAVKLEKEFLKALPIGLVGLNYDLTCQYIEFIADWLLNELGCEKIYNTKNPFDLFVHFACPETTDFQKKNVEFHKGVILNNESDEYVLDVDF